MLTLADPLEYAASASPTASPLKVIEISDEPLPKSGPGKILKRLLREQHLVDRHLVR